MRLNKRPILEVLDDIGVVMEHKQNYMVGCCPLHDDTNPSFVVYHGKEYYMCFSCDPEGGDVIQLYMKYKNCSFAEAVQFTCENNGTDVDKLELDDMTSVGKEDQQELYATYVRELFTKFPYADVVEADSRARFIIEKYGDIALGRNILNSNLFKYETAN
jgi:DNA primase